MPPGDSTTLIDFSHHDVEFARDPFNTLNTLLEDTPIAWSSKHDGFWVLSRYEDVTAAFRDFKTFSSKKGAAIPALSLGGDHIPVSLDPPLHAAYRKILNPWFTMEAIKEREDEIQEFVRDTVRQLAENGSWDFVTDIGDVIPGTVVLGIIGMDASRRAEFLERMALGMSNQGTSDPDIIAQVKKDKAWLDSEILDCMRARREKPEDDLMTVLANDPLGDGTELDDHQMLGVVMLLILAGFNTTSGAFAAMMVYLSEHPDQRRKLAEDPSLIPAAIEEIIRVYSPATAEGRFVTQDVEVGGETLNAGDFVLLNIASANKDPRMFENPLEVDFERNNTRSIAFGWGVHRCLGMQLARLLLRTEVEAVMEFMPEYELDVEGVKRSDAMGVGYVHEFVPARMPS